MHRRGLVRWALALAIMFASLVVAMPAQAADSITETALTIDGTPEADGRPVKLDLTLLTTDPKTAKPAIVLAHGFGGTKADSLPTARTLARDGYAVIVYTARGFGESGGLIHLDSPAYEGADARKIVSFAATRAEIIHTGTDPVLGFAGASYGGAVSLIAGGLDKRIDAIVPAFTWHDLRDALFPQNATTGSASSVADVTPTQRPGVFKQRWASLLFLGAGGRSGGGPGSGGSGGAGSGGAGSESSAEAAVCGRFAPALCAGYLRAAETGTASDQLLDLLRAASPAPILSRINAPTLFIQGEDDTLFPLDQADANLRGLPSGTAAAMKWVEGGHDASISTDDLVPEIEAWFDRYLKHDGTPVDTSFSVVVPQTSLVGQGGNQDPDTLVSAAYPGRGVSLDEQWFGLAGDSQTIIAPPGGSPSALTNLPGTGGVLAAGSSIAGYALGVLAGQSATFTTEPLTDPLDLVGSGRVDLDITSTSSTATLFASLWDLGSDIDTTANGRTISGPSSAVLPGLAVSPIRLTGLTPGQARPVTIALPSVAHQVPVGHRLRLVVSTTDQAYAVPSKTAIYTVALSGDQAVVVPKLAAATVSGAGKLDVPIALPIVVGALVIAAIGFRVFMWSRRRQAHPRPDLFGVPLVVDGVVKTYRDGFKAVDGVSFRAEPGQVVGLLGPNGAGKTTVMRMLVGLIRPDTGEIFVHGQPVHAGADVLGSVGAFIEGPGFLPHLTGRQNLDAYWEATGRPREEAHFEEALDIAGLGDGLDRRVRGYSQGMRQRLGIAQAMLGLPSLLLLDEPTNGLDPPQIKAMRQVLLDYARAGRTVVVSSHLLAEVEHTCSHVVVMNKGKVVLTGSVADLTASDSVTLIGLADETEIVGAQAALEDGGLVAEPEGQVLRVSGDVPRPEIVARLVDGGFRVESVDGHRQLEEVFMNLVANPTDGTGSAGSNGASGNGSHVAEPEKADV